MEERAAYIALALAVFIIIPALVMLVGKLVDSYVHRDLMRCWDCGRHAPTGVCTGPHPSFDIDKAREDGNVQRPISDGVCSDPQCTVCRSTRRRVFPDSLQE